MTVFLSNDATAIVLTPAVYLAVLVLAMPETAPAREAASLRQAR